MSGKNGAVASSQPLASEVGLEILKQGGSAVDAAIASNAMLGLTEPHMCGPGGDLFAITWDAGSTSLHGLNASGRSPRSLGYDALRQRLAEEDLAAIPMHGLLSVSVPGAVDGWFALHARFGQLSMSTLLAPAIEYAERGFALTPVIAGEWQQFSDEETLVKNGDFDKVYRPGGAAPAAGELFQNPLLAETYRCIAEEGRAGFYEGGIAAWILDYMAENGGYISRDDLSMNEPEWVTPLSVDYRGYDIYELPPNCQGLAALQMFAMLRGFDFPAAGTLDAEIVHRMIETKKLAFEDRGRFYADPGFSPAPMEGLLGDDYAARRAALIGDRAARQVSAGDPLLKNSDTVYLATADRKGNMVSLIQSIFHPFGSRVVVPGTGFALQNRGLLFSMDARHANVYAAGKRPFQTIIPGFVMQSGRPFMSFGVMGGDMQPQGHVQVLCNILDFGMDLQEAGDMPRWRHDGSTQPTDSAEASLGDGGRLVLEAGFSAELASGLAERGHAICDDDHGFGFGGYQAILRREDGGYLAASESRKDGCALVY